MFQFIGYNLFSDSGALDSAPSNLDNITTTRLSNAIFDHFNITRNTNTPYSTTIPSGWDYDTVLDADFEGNLSAGNIDLLVEQVNAVKVKRRIKGTFDWLTLATIPVNTVDDLVFVFNDFLNAYGVEYEYALVPILNDIEGDYIIDSILSKFNGIFIGDANQTFKFLYNPNYGTNARNQQVGTFQPLGRKYPIVVGNGVLSYESGSVTATILNDDYEDTGIVDPVAIVKKKTVIKDFLTNKKAKLLRDWNGNVWLCMIINAVPVNYLSGSGMSIPQIQFDWVQIGDANNQTDLYNSGVIDEPG